MGRLRYTSAARQDLLDLWAHIATNDPTVADRIVDRIENACGRLRDHPRLGPERPEIGEDARVLIIDRWLAIYRLIQGGAQVVRIVDGARDLVRLSWPSDQE